MKRALALLLCSTVLVACSSGSKPVTEPVNVDKPAVPSQPPQVTPPAPPQPQAPQGLKGPVWLLSAPASPLLAGPMSSTIENSPQARPQIGFAEADLVVEALAEAEITRMLAFYWSKPAEKIGPVRSARTFFVSLANAYGAPIAHAGGSNDALAMIREGRTKDLDEIHGGAGGFFWRSADREMPHNLYTSTDLLKQGTAAFKYSMAAVPTSPRAEAPFPASGAVTKVDLAWHRLHNISWQWDGKEYRRTEHDGPHKDEQGDVVHARNLIFLDVEGESYGEYASWNLFMEKGGKATVISGGRQWGGTWSLEDGGLQIQPDGGEAPPLLPGQVWVHLVTKNSAVTFTKQ